MSSESFEQAWRKRFEKYANFSSDAQIAGWSEHSLKTRVQAFTSHWKAEHPNAYWADLGCGVGTYTQILLQGQQKVLALDYSLPTLEKAKQKLLHQSEYVVADVRALPITSHLFEGVICFGVLQALSNPLSALDEMARLLKDNGQLWVDGLNRCSIRFFVEWLKHVFFRQNYRLIYVNPWALKSRLEQLSFRKIEIIWVPIFPKKYHKIQDKLSNLISKYGKYMPFIASLVSHAFIIKAS